ncbi:MAG: lysophospholipid acyltransferase family protein [Alphaproteobacteria bacterium]|nr:lysophospholipid acyltransferase family protein [Alphaproteobacteria bacterium]
MIPGLRGLYRLLAVLWCMARGGYTLWRHQARWSQAQLAQAVQHWAQDMLCALGVRLQVHGQPAPGPVLWVANHIAWLDILILHAQRQAHFVAKSEVHRWPLIGPMAAAAGTLFIERASRRDALRVVHQMAEALQQGGTVAVFPEGTTSLGDTVLPFHANLLQAAVASETPVQPALIRYLDDRSRPAAHVRYVGDDTLVASVWQVLRAPVTVAVVQWAPAQRAQGRDRRAWAHDLRAVLQDLQR